ncbi:Atu4866 domain-containing protein [Nesterenkonia haasae]|uniref:Atu4866 domain-containing protein n=1 Tax=Nesterenkonia haasae TaxID=2587813 RepID=UPI001391A328|nr:Atu4866 domain-containing protein [Nesterenkonia haasae]
MTSSLIITGARIHTSPEQNSLADLQVEGRHISPYEIAQDSAYLINAGGASVVPLLVNTVFHDPEPPAHGAFDLAPGHPATFAVIKGPVSSTQIRQTLIVQPQDLIALVVEGEIIVYQGRPTRPAGADELDSADPRLGAWTDARRHMTQYLTREGRYTETRNGRRNAYTGRFWLTDNRITYLDDTGFWAFGQYHRGVLHHAGYVLRPDAHT